MTPQDLKKISELLTELGWHMATFVSFIPESSKERKPFELRMRELRKLRDLCETEALK